MNCCDKPDIWTNNGRWPAVDGLVFGVCVRCAAIVIASELRRRYTPLNGRSLLTLYRHPRTRWIYDELLIEQKCVRDVLVPRWPVWPVTFELTEATA